MTTGIRFCILASGSAGNAFFLETERSKILVDAGLSCTALLKKLEEKQIDPGQLNGLILTHEHSDHVAGAGALVRRLGLPVYLNQQTFDRCRRSMGKIPKPVIIKTGQSFNIGQLHFETFTKCHDAADPVGLVCSVDGHRIGLLTDLGRATGLVLDRLRGCQALVLEFNYDSAMLACSPYPLHVIRRIKGSEGHLSNEQASEILSALSHQDLKYVVLAHLSETNNRGERAQQYASEALNLQGLSKTDILVAKQNVAGPMIEL